MTNALRFRDDRRGPISASALFPRAFALARLRLRHSEDPFFKTEDFAEIKYEEKRKKSE